MTPEDLAHLHARAMKITAPWRETDFADLLETPGTFLTTLPPSSWPKYAGGGEQSERGAEPPSTATRSSAAQSPAFALGRITLDEAELLTLAVDPMAHRQGLGRATLAAFEAEAVRRGATRAFLDVAETNSAARALYQSAGWHETGTRAHYYRTPKARISAILMGKSLKPD